MHRQLQKTIFICIAVLLLAALCISTTELLVCRVVDPGLYDQITDTVYHKVAEPVQQFAQAQQQQLLKLNQQVFDNMRSVAVSIANYTADYAEQVEQAQLPPDDALLPPAPLAGDPSLTTLIEREDGQLVLTGSYPELIYYNQKDAPWADQLYGTDPIGGYGCGPTAMSIVVSSLLEQTSTPAEMAQFCYESGYWCKKQGSYLSIVNGVADAFGLSCTPVKISELDQMNLMAHLSNGDLAVALMAQGHFTSSGHFIVLRGVTLDGQILVADPASLERSLTAWDLDLIISELSPSRSSGSPLWLLSLPSGE